MSSYVSQRFIEAFQYLLDTQQVPSARQFSMALDYAPQNMGEILKGRREVTIELLKKAVDNYDLNPEYLFNGSHPILGNSKQGMAAKILTIVTDQLNTERIIHVPVPAQAGYAEQVHDKEFVEELPSYQLPGHEFSQGSYRSFDVSGDSMEPMLSAGDTVICEYFEPQNWKLGLKESKLYVLVLDDAVLVKKLSYASYKADTLEIHSLNPAYPMFLAPFQDIREVWEMKAIISKSDEHLNRYDNELSSQMDDLKSALLDQLKTLDERNEPALQLVK